MNLFRLVIRSLVHYHRTGLAIIFGVAVAAAALTGSLLVGHSVTGSLRDTALARLGSITHALTAPREFRAQLASDLRQQHSWARQCAALYQTTGAVTNAESEAVVPKVNIIGVDDDFWALYGTKKTLDGRQAIVNTALARDLGIKKDGSCLINLLRGGAIGSGNLFAQRSLNATQRTLRVTITEVAPDQGAGGFSLTAGSTTPRNLFVSREWLLSMLDKGDVANGIAMEAWFKFEDRFLSSRSHEQIIKDDTASTCTLQDYGLSLVPSRQLNCLLLQSDGMVLPNAVVSAGQLAAKACKAASRRSSVYLASRITASRLTVVVPGQRTYAYHHPEGKRGISYVLLASIEGTIPKFGYTFTDWAATDLGIIAGDSAQIDYLVPTLDGQFTTRNTSFIVHDIVPVNPAHAALVPPIEGVSDANRIDAWQAPFPVEMSRITDRDEAYWEKYKTTPKAYVDLETIHKMWASGPQGKDADWVTSLRIAPPAGKTLAQFAKDYEMALLKRLDPADAGLAFRPIRLQALAAATGTTDFGQLFIAMSFFLVAAAAGLAGMLMRLMAEGRAAQAGMMLAQGFTEKVVARAFLLEGLVLSAAGTLLGVPLGILYAWALIRGLTSWWQGAVGETALWLHLGAGPLLIGVCCGLLVGVGAVAWGVRGLTRRPVLALLGGWQALGTKRGRRAPVATVSAIALFVIALVFIGLGIGKLITPLMAFFTGGTALLIVGLCGCAAWLTSSVSLPALPVSLPRLALRNAAVNRGRSLLVVGLLASATFLVVTVAANERDFTRLNSRDRASGTGGFALQAIAAAPLPYDLSTPAGRANLGFSAEDETLFHDVTVYPFLMSPGDDISCLNLNRPTAPRVVGVPPAMATRGGFTLHGAGWQALTGSGEPIPAFGDAASVEWSLHSAPGQVYHLQTPGGARKLRFTGTLASSIFGSELLVSKANFNALFPGITMPRYFLIETPAGREKAIADALRRNLGELGLEVRDTREVLNGYIRVQNTYLSMFLAIGGLGMLLGTVGLLLALLRNALERRREFALMLATGFQTNDLTRLLVLENGGLLLAGLVLGTVAALVAVAPQTIATDAHIHWPAIISLLLAILAVGLGSTLVAARAAVRGSLLAALRGE